jgi:2-iminoacetate synthase
MPLEGTSPWKSRSFRGSKTCVGGYAESRAEDKNRAFDVSVPAPLCVVKLANEAGLNPSFCTACYARGARGTVLRACRELPDTKLCYPNALMTVKEYLIDYS